ncbi:hypothetical protein [Tenacibaculum sp. M341]|uniref:hypothetical protein n=1 Tax=Tenacibaculum sp. M341 TaxID=2530339 RepID=UPI001048454F|nr:hypothetical protein [Tenacibaculum sp. M341]TCI85324.1 hypothetical protein EYW44_17270 [Tenacibaculum sp. M341]
MIDGIKIQLPSRTATMWLSNSLLDFHTYTNVNTGELLDNTIVAKYKGLVFIITQSQKDENTHYCYVRGSLHKYFNNGKHNYNEFSFNDLQNVITDLKNKFSIEPETAILRNVEFGVNINTPISAKQLLKDLVAYGNYTFGTLTVANKKVGKMISQQQVKLKIYDKGTQYKTKTNNLTRIEIAVKKMEYLKKYNISTLTDILNLKKLKPLGTLLQFYWDKIIYFDKSIKYKNLTNFERKKLLYYATPRNWVEFNRTQRMRAKKHYSKLVQTYGSTTQLQISNLINEKWEELTAKKCIRINHNINSISQQGNVYELTVSIDGQNVNKTSLKGIDKILPENTIEKQSKKQDKKYSCTICKSDISQKRKGAKYCSKKCNNKSNGMQRTKKRQKRILEEKKYFQNLIKKLHKNDLNLIISYKVGTSIYTDNLLQSEINTTLEWIQNIVEVSVTQSKKNNNKIILTSYRARKLIKYINRINK